MIYTKSQFAADQPCQPGFDFAASYNFDFVKLYAVVTEPGWMLWLADKGGVMTQDAALKLATTFESQAMQIYKTIHPEDTLSQTVLGIATTGLTGPVSVQSDPQDCGLFTAWRIAAGKCLNPLWTQVSLSANLALTYQTFSLDPKDPKTATIIAQIKSAQCDQIRLVIPCPFQ